MATMVRLGPQWLLAATPGDWHDQGGIVGLPDGSLAVWTLASPPGGGPDVIRLKIYDTQTHGLKAATAIDIAAAGILGQPLITHLANGHLVLAWTSGLEPRAGHRVWLQEFDARARGLGPPVEVSPPNRDGVLDSVTALPAGGFAVGWTQRKSGDPSALQSANVFSRIFDADGKPGPALRLNLSTDGAEAAAHLAAAPGGGLRAVWVKEVAGLKQLVMRGLSDDGTPVTGERIVSESAGDLADPGVKVLRNGAVLLHWLQAPQAESPLPAPHRAHFTLFTADMTATLGRFEHKGRADAGALEVLELRDGRLLLAWAEMDTSGDSPLVTRKAVFMTAEGAVSRVLTLTERTVSGSCDFHMTELADGRIAMAWPIDDATGRTDEVMQIFDPRLTGITLTASGPAVSWVGSAHGDRLTGAAGHDLIFGAEGRDLILGGAGQDVLSGGPGRDRILGGDGHDRLAGQAGDDRLRGGPGDDSLYGGAGADTLMGEGGNDFLTGGAGADVFVLAPAGGNDRVTDFENGTDRIDLSAFGFAKPQQALANFGQSPAGVVFSHGGSTVLFSATSLAAFDASDLLI